MRINSCFTYQKYINIFVNYMLWRVKLIPQRTYSIQTYSVSSFSLVHSSQTYFFSLSTSFINEGLMLSKNMSFLELIHCLKRSFSDSQLIFSYLIKRRSTIFQIQTESFFFGVIVFRVGLSPSKKIVLFASMKSLEK